MHIYFSGIGGVGLGPLAEIAHDNGHVISGSDVSASPTFVGLQKKGFDISLDQSGTYMKSVNNKQPIDWFVYTAALPTDHPERIFAQNQHIKMSKRDGLLKEIIEKTDQKLIAVAGTHGKTTTTAMIVWLFKQLHTPVSYLVGAALSWAPSGVFDPDSRFFVYECDEFDRNFLQFKPYLSLITSLDYDHADTYKDKQAYDEAFEQFKSQSQASLTWEGLGSKIIKLPGQHNRRNGALAVNAVSRLSGEPPEKVAALLTNFPGSSRRFEKLTENIYSDYAHHPDEIAATLQLAHELSDEIVVVYQPHQNIRQHHLEYGDSFKQAQKVYWLPTYLSREDPTLSILSPQELTKNIQHNEIIVADLNDKLWQDILAEKQAGKMVILMGAGSIDEWAHQQLL